MIAKFVRDEHGLRLELSGNTDHERVLMHELNQYTVARGAKRGLRLVQMPQEGKVAIWRGQPYVTAQTRKELGFVPVERYWTGEGTMNYFYIKQEGNYTYILRGTGVYTLYKFDKTISEEYNEYWNGRIIGYLFGIVWAKGKFIFSSKDDYTDRYFEWSGAWAKQVWRGIQTAPQLRVAMGYTI